MSYRDKMLAEKTFKDNGLETAQRIFYTLGDEQVEPHRAGKLLALLIARLEAKGIVTDDEIDDLLFECVL